MLGYAAYYQYNEVKQNVIPESESNDKKTIKSQSEVKELTENLKTGFIVSYANYPDSVPVYTIKTKDKTVNSIDLVKMGFAYKPVNNCKIIIKVGKNEQTVTCDNPAIK